MTEPLLNGPQIHSSPQASRGERVVATSLRIQGLSPKMLCDEQLTRFHTLDQIPRGPLS